MNLSEKTLMITPDAMPDCTCSAVWGGKRSITDDICTLDTVIWKSSAVWGSRTLWMSNVPQPFPVLRTSAAAAGHTANLCPAQEPEE